MIGRLLVLVSSLTLALPSSAAITGIVMNGDGEAVAGARVSAFAPESLEARRKRVVSDTPERTPLTAAQTDAKGRFSLDTPKEHAVLSLLIESSGYAPQGVSVERDDDIGAISLTRAPAKTGRITAGGKPVSGARVLWTGAGEAIAVTDESGRYTVPDPSKWAFRVTVVHPDFARVDETVRRGTSAKADVDRTLDAGVTITGRVVGADGRTPAAGASLSVDGWPSGKSGEDGTFTLSRIPARWESIEAQARNLVGRRVRGGDGTVRLQPAVTVTGTVRDAKTQAPVVGADVSLLRPTRIPDSAFSDSKGNFSIPNVIPGSYSLNASHPGFSFSPTSASVVAGDKSARTVVGTKRARVIGAIVDEEKRNVAGARILPQTVSRGEMFGPMMMMATAQQPAMSGPDGTFSVRVNPDADIQIEARKKGLPSGRSATLRLSPGERKSGVIIMIAAGVTLSGRVVDRQGKPLSGVSVAATEPRPGMGMGMTSMTIGGRREREDDFVRSNDEGGFSIQLEPGSYDLTFRHDGFAIKMLRAQEVTTAMRPIEVTLEPGVEVSGRVTRGGVGVPDVMVSVNADGVNETMETGADGSFRFSNLIPGEMFLNARKPDEFIQQFRPIKAPARDIEIEVPPGGRVIGRVFDKETRQPVTAFEAGISGSRGGGGMVFVGPSQTRPFTADDGTFVLDNVPAGSSTLVVTAAGYTSANVPNIIVEEGKSTAEVEVALDRGVRVIGRVTGPDGAALSGVSVRLNPASGRVMRAPSFGSGAVTDAGGSYTLEAVEPGEQTLMFSRSGYVSTEKKAELRGREVRVDAQLSSGMRVTGTVVNESGAPIADAFVSASSSASRGGSTRTDQNGGFQMEALAPGRYTFRAQKQGYPGAELKDTDISTGAPLRLVLKSGGTIYGRVIGLPADELAQMTVFASNPNGSSTAPVDAMGNFRIEGAPTGTVRLTARSGRMVGGKSSPTRSVEVAPGATVQQDIEFNTATLIRGRVTRGGGPVSGATVMFFPREAQAQTIARVQADAQGYYEASGLDDATYNVMVNDMQRFSTFSTTYEVRGSGTFDIDMRTSSVRGRVTDANTGQPLAGAAVEVRSRDSGGVRFSMMTVQTDAAGAFTIPEIGAGSYHIGAEKDGYGTKVVDLDVADAPAELEIKLTPNPGVTLRVVDARDGRMVAARVTVTDLQNRVVYETPMRFGGGTEAVKIGIDPGSYRASVMASGYATQNIQITSPGTMTVGMTPGGSILVRSKGGGLRRARLMGADGRKYSRGYGSSIFTIDPSPGVTQLDHVAPGSYTLQILGDRGEVTGTTHVTVGEGQRAIVEI